MKLSISTTGIWHRHKYVSDYISSLKRKLLEVHPYLIITMEPVLYIPAGTRQLELIMYILSFSYSCRTIWKENLFSECCSLSCSCTLFLKKTGNLKHSSPKGGVPSPFQAGLVSYSPERFPNGEQWCWTDDWGQSLLGLQMSQRLLRAVSISAGGARICQCNMYIDEDPEWKHNKFLELQNFLQPGNFWFHLICFQLDTLLVL